MTTTIKVIILSGRSGAGKTSLANELSSQLSQLSIPHVNIDGDNLDSMFPEEQDAEIMLQNLELIWGVYFLRRRKSCAHLILSGTGMVLERHGIELVIRRATRMVLESDKGNNNNDENTQTSEGIKSGKDDGAGDRIEITTKCFILTAADEAVAERLEKREVGSTLERHLESSAKMAKVLGEIVEEGSASPVQTTGRRVVELALDVLYEAQWLS